MYKNNINEMLLDKELYCARIFGLPVIICNYNRTVTFFRLL